MSVPPQISQGDVDTAELRRLVQRGDQSALGRLMQLQMGALTRWAHRRLPRWARNAVDTADLVQEAVLNTLGRMTRFEVEHRGALQAYLRRAVANRISDELRRVQRRGISLPVPDDYSEPGPTPFESAAAGELERVYKQALTALSERDQMLVVAHVELEYTLDQLTCMSGRTHNATRVALRRALLKLGHAMARLTHERAASAVRDGE